MSTLVSSIINEVNLVLNDPNFIRWPKEELIKYFNASREALTLRRPDAVTTDIEFSCVAGTKQTGPDDMHRLLDVPYNIDGAAIRGPYERKTLDDTRPDWRTTTGESAAQVFTYDERNPKTFNLYPGVAVGTKINIVYTKMLAPLAVGAIDDGTSTTEIDELWDNSLIDWILYRCYSKDAEYTANGNRAQMHLNAFKAAIGEKNQADNTVDIQTRELTDKKQ